MEPGCLVGRYRLQSRVAESPTGTAFRVWIGTSPLELRLLHRLPRRRELVDRLKRDACTAATVTHPDALRLIDFGLHEQVPYLVSEAATLPGLRAELPLSPLIVVRLLDRLAQLLATLHSDRIGHGSLHVDNIFAQPLPGGWIRVQVRDAGMGRWWPDPSHLAPEQSARGACDERADLYCLGALAHECLTGEVPGRCRGLAHLDVPHSLMRLIEGLLLPRPEDRSPVSARSLRAALAPIESRLDPSMPAYRDTSTPVPVPHV